MRERADSLVPPAGLSGAGGAVAVTGKVVMLAAMLLLGACTGAGPEPAVVRPLPAPPQPAGPTQEEIRQRAIAHFLTRAEEAEREGFLTMPAGASAYDFYLNVQQMDPGNQRAATGIQSIVLQLVDQARDALRQRSFGRVNSLLNTAEQIAPGNPLSAEVREQLQRERARASADAVPTGAGAQSVPLSTSELDARSESMSQVLSNIAQRIRDHQMRVVIIARTDAEGRWIYSQLRQAVPGFRVRGDIKLGSPPRLLLQKQ